MTQIQTTKGTLNTMKKHMMKRALCAVLSLLMVVTTFAFVPTSAASTAWNGTDETYDWYVNAEGTASDPYLISKPSDLAGWSALTNGTYNYRTLNALTGFTENSAIMKKFDGKYFRITADLDMGSKNFTPIYAANGLTDGAAALIGEVHLDGQNHTIKNLTIDDVAGVVRAYAGLFYYLGAGSDIRNLHFVNAQIHGNRAAVVAGEASTQDMTVYNVSVDSTSSVRGDQFGGGLFCLMVDKRDLGKSSSFAYCVNAATVTSKIRMGGIVASYQTSDDVTFSYCVNKGNLISTNQTHMGGIVGTTMDSMPYGINFRLENCYNTGNLTINGNANSSRVSGMLGSHSGHADHTYTAISCYDVSNRNINTVKETVKIEGKDVERDGTAYHSAMGIGFAVHATSAKKTLDHCYAVKGTLTGYAYEDTVGSALRVGGNTTLGGTVTSSLMVASTTTSITLKDGTTSTVKAEMERIDETIASLRNVKLSLMDGRLSVRIGLVDPYGFMTITKLTDNAGNAVEYDEAGFAYSTERQDPFGIMAEENAKVVGQDYIERGESTGEFYSCYADLWASELDTTVYVVAYARVGDHVLLSETREINLYEVTYAVMQGAFADVNFPEYERNVYSKMLAYHATYVEYLDSTLASQWLKVATYNVYHCGDVRLWDHNKSDTYNAFNANIVNVENIANFMIEYDLDVLTMNETCRYSTDYNDGNTAQAERIAALLTQKTGKTYYWAFAKAQTKATGEFGNAIVSKYPIKNVTNGYVESTALEQVGTGDTGSKRCLGHAELNVNGQTVSVLFTHFSLDEKDRLKAVEQVQSKVQSIKSADSKRAIIFMGDLNEHPYSANGMYDGLLSFLSPTAPKNQLPLTHSNLRPATTIDYIMHSSNVVSKDLYAPGEVMYSDHLPVIVTVGLPKN